MNSTTQTMQFKSEKNMQAEQNFKMLIQHCSILHLQSLKLLSVVVASKQKENDNENVNANPNPNPKPAF